MRIEGEEMTDEQKEAIKQAVEMSDEAAVEKPTMPLTSGAQHDFYQQLASWGMLKDEAPSATT